MHLEKKCVYISVLDYYKAEEVYDADTVVYIIIIIIE